MSVADQLKLYALRIRELRRANAEVPETALAPAFQQLLDGVIPFLSIPPGLTVMPEFRHPGVGRPDIALLRTGAPARAFVELKAPAKSADPTRWRDADKRQFERFQELACWATSNFSEIRLFFRSEEQTSATIVPEQWLRPDRDDARADRAIAAHDTGPFVEMVEQLCRAAGSEPRARDAEHLAQLMAHSARLVRGIVRDRVAELGTASERHALLEVRELFRNVLYSHPEAAGYRTGDFNELFAGAFAQTLAFGLLLVREATGQDVQPSAWEHMPDEHPLMKTALRVLSQPEVIRDIGIGFDVLRDTVNSFAPAILERQADKPDPILYFYEDFLKTFDPEARKNYGVYYTPIEVVQYMVGALDRALRENLSTEGLRDPAVTILDPATGTGTFLLGIAERVRDQEAAGGEGMAESALHNLAHRMFGFELLVGPYAVAHYRLHHALRRPRRDGTSAPDLLPRLGVFLADTLAEPGAASAAGSLGFVSEGIADERQEANRIKAEQPILAIIGNPPYRRLEEGENRTLLGEWMDRLWDDLKAPVRDAGHGNQLNTFPELSVAFWRWAIWKLFEAENAPRRGVVAFITNRKFLTGWPYAGLRQMMRQRFDRIEIFDLRGDVRRGERAGVEADQGVFNIQVGTAITIAIADGSRAEGGAARVLYGDSWAEGLFSRRSKLDRLASRAGAGTLRGVVTVERAFLDDMRPAPFQNESWVSLRECFIFASSGLESKRDDVTYAVSRVALERRVQHILSLSGEALSETFNSTLMNPAEAAKVVGWQEKFVTLGGYRPLDRRWHYSSDAWNDRPRPSLRAVWGTNNICLFSLPSGTNAGPGVWCHAAYPDRHAFRGSYGGYAFPLFDRRPSVSGTNFARALITGLSAAYGVAVSAEDAFDAVLCILSASSYTLRFAEDLEDAFPHVVFPARHEVFLDAVRVGREIRAVETFAREPTPRGADFMRVETRPRGEVVPVDLVGESLALCADGSGRITGIPQAVWNFAVSGYRVLPRWLEARVGLTADHSFVREFRDICGRIAELIELFARADTILDAALRDSLSREALNLAPPRAAADDGPD